MPSNPKIRQDREHYRRAAEAPGLAGVTGSSETHSYAGLGRPSRQVVLEAPSLLLPVAAKKASHIARGFPHDFLASTDFILGGMSGQLDLPPGQSAHG